MSKKKKNLPLLENVRIDAIAAEGNAVGRVDDFVVFVPFAAPGDILNVQIRKKHRSYAEGFITDIVKPSPFRVPPRCPHYSSCGGCRWQHLRYDQQLLSKQQIVAEALHRIAKIPLPDILPTLPSDNIWHYRNKMEYTFSNRKWLPFDQFRSGDAVDDLNAAGFHIPGAFDKVLDINQCFLQDDLGNQIRNFIKKYAIDHNYTFYDLRNHQGLLRTLTIRIASSGETMVILAFGEDNPTAIRDILSAINRQFPEITSLLYVVNTKLNDSIADLNISTFAGRPFIEEQMENLRFRIGPKSFYQTNSAQAFKLYSAARQFASLSGNELVYDLYTGTGTIANFVAPLAKRVIGIEYVPDAIEDAKLNSAINNIHNTEFFAGDMKDVLTNDFISLHGQPDVIIVDPPRAGIHPDVINVILNAHPKIIVYVSCNPATQARDIALLHPMYQVTHVQPVDMFPHTHHVENVVRLLRQDTNCNNVDRP